MEEYDENERARYRKVTFFVSSISYLLYITTPIHFAMVTVGFIHKEDCPIDVRIPRYLCFGGLAGLMTILLRILLICQWRRLKKRHKDIDAYDPSMHGGWSMVRSVMYIFLLFVVIWNIYATFRVLAVEPNLEDPTSDDYCHPTVYRLSYVLVILFDAITGVFFFIWIFAIIAGILFPGLLVHFGYFPSTTEVTFKKKSNRSESESETEDEREQSTKLNITNERKSKSLPRSKGENGSNSWKMIYHNGRKNEEDDEDDDYDEDRHTLSIVRFAREVNSRRISVDFNAADRLDITNFPSGPLKANKDNEQQGQETKNL